MKFQKSISISKKNSLNIEHFNPIIDTADTHVESSIRSSQTIEPSLSNGLQLRGQSATFWRFSSWFSFASFLATSALQADEISDGSKVDTMISISLEIIFWSFLISEVPFVRCLFFAWPFCFLFLDVPLLLFRRFFRGCFAAALVMLGEFKTSIVVEDTIMFKRIPVQNLVPWSTSSYGASWNDCLSCLKAVYVINDVEEKGLQIKCYSARAHRQLQSQLSQTTKKEAAPNIFPHHEKSNMFLSIHASIIILCTPFYEIWILTKRDRYSLWLWQTFPIWAVDEMPPAPLLLAGRIESSFSRFVFSSALAFGPALSRFWYNSLWIHCSKMYKATRDINRLLQQS